MATNPGFIKDKKSVNVPGASMKLQSLSEKDRRSVSYTHLDVYKRQQLYSFLIVYRVVFYILFVFNYGYSLIWAIVNFIFLPID